LIAETGRRYGQIIDYWSARNA